jgi:hypothetical protein
MRRTNLLIAGAAVTCFVTQQACADAGLMGWGAIPCGEFAAHYEKDVNTESDAYAWAQGYMSGLNVAYMKKLEPVRDLSSKTQEDQKRAIRLFCDAHPLSDYHSAVEELYDSLRVAPPPLGK